MALHRSEILTLYRSELRSALRDRTVVVNSIVVPLVLYPVVLWTIFSGIAFVRGQNDDLRTRLAFVHDGSRVPSAPTAEGSSPAMGDLERLFRDDRRFELSPPIAMAEAETRLRRPVLDVALVVENAPFDGVRVRLLHDGARDRSAVGRERVLGVIDRYRETHLRSEALARDVPLERWAGFVVDRKNAATGREMGSFLLGLLLPLFFIIMVALGCLNPAIDTIAGERERGTWETLMTTAASRASILLAKYLMVTTLGGLAGVLNIAAMMVTMRGVVGPLMGGADQATLEFGIPLRAIPVVIVGGLLLAGFLAAAMMVAAAFARTFREGQAAVTPFYLAAVLPGMFLATPGLQLTWQMALVPIVNVALAVRDAMTGTIRPLELSIVVIAVGAGIAALLRLAALVIAVEEVMTGAFSGGLLTFLRQRMRARS